MDGAAICLKRVQRFCTAQPGERHVRLVTGDSSPISSRANLEHRYVLRTSGWPRSQRALLVLSVPSTRTEPHRRQRTLANHAQLDGKDHNSSSRGRRIKVGMR